MFVSITFSVNLLPSEINISISSFVGQSLFHSSFCNFLHSLRQLSNGQLLFSLQFVSLTLPHLEPSAPHFFGHCQNILTEAQIYSIAFKHNCMGVSATLFFKISPIQGYQLFCFSKFHQYGIFYLFGFIRIIVLIDFTYS